MILTFNSNLETIGNSLMKTLSEIETYRETPKLKAKCFIYLQELSFAKKILKNLIKNLEYGCMLLPLFRYKKKKVRD